MLVAWETMETNAGALLEAKTCCFHLNTISTRGSDHIFSEESENVKTSEVVGNYLDQSSASSASLHGCKYGHTLG